MHWQLDGFVPDAARDGLPVTEDAPSGVVRGTWRGVPALLKSAAAGSDVDLRQEWRTLLSLPQSTVPEPLAFVAARPGLPAALVLRLAEGQTWRTAMPSWTEQELLGALDSALAVLTLLHDQAICHADLHADNLLWRAGEVRLLDLGLAAPVGRIPAGPGVPGCASPQRLRGEAVSASDDLFALAATVWLARCGRHPWPDYPAVLPSPGARPEPASGLSAALTGVLARWLAADVGHRPQHARAARTELAQLFGAERGRDAADLAAALQAASPRPLRLGAFGAALPAGAVVVAESGNGASSWLLERASTHPGAVGWFASRDGELGCWPLGTAHLEVPASPALLGDPQGAELAACSAQLHQWLAALGANGALAVDDVLQLPTVWQRALLQLAESGQQVWLARPAAGVDGESLGPATATELTAGIRAVSGCDPTDALVAALLAARLPRRDVWPALADAVQGDTVRLEGRTLDVHGRLRLSRADRPQAPSAPVPNPKHASEWIELLRRAREQGTLEQTERALCGWLAEHRPSSSAAELRTSWLTARAALGLGLPGTAGKAGTAGNRDRLADWLALPERAPDSLALAAMAFRQGDYAASAEHATAAETSAESPLQRASAVRWRAFALTWAGERAEAQALVQRGLSATSADPDLSYLAALLDYYAGELDRADAGFAALVGGAPAAVAAAARTGQGLVAHRRGALPLARQHYEAARNLALGCGDRLRALNMQMNVAVLDQEAGELAEALHRYDQAAKEAEQLGNEGAALRIRLNRANLLAVLGMDEAAAELVVAALPLLDGGANQLLAWNAHQLLAEIHHRAGWLDRAENELQAAMACLQATEAQTERWEWQLAAALLANDRDDPARAQALVATVRTEADKPEWRARALQAEAAVAWRVALRDGELAGDLVGGKLTSLQGLLAEAAELAPTSKPVLQALIALDRLKLAIAGADLAAAAGLASDHHARLARIRAALPERYRTRFACSGPLRDAWQAFEWLRRVPGSVSQVSAGRSEGGMLHAIVAINRRLSEVHELPALLDIVMDAAILLTGAERGFLLLEPEGSERGRKRGADHDVGELTVRVARNLDRENLTRPAGRLSHSIACKVYAEAERVVTTDATQDARFATQASVHSASLRSILCVPLLAQGRPLGCLYVDNRFTSGAFSAEHVSLLEALADQAAIAMTTASLVQRLQASVAAQAEQQKAIESLNVQLQTRLEETEDALDTARADLSAQRLEVQRRSDFDAIKGESPKLHQLFAVMERVREHDFAVLVRGESGTGKELVARAIHFTGKRKRGPFVAINCGALPSNLLESELFGHARGAFTGATHERRGLFEAAHGGTLLLDEVGEMPLDMQVKLLRVLQSGEILRVGEQLPRRVDVRVVAATHRDLHGMVGKGQFREDLYYRLRVIELQIPPLRERPEDLPLLVEHFLRENRKAGVGKVERLTPKALQVLRQYPFPGNVRQLETVLKSACVFAERDTLDVADLTAVLPRDAEVRAAAASGEWQLPAHATLFALEGAAIRERLTQFAGNKRKAAESLGIDRGTLYNRLRAHGLADGNG